MGTLYDIAQEYRANQSPIERRIEDLSLELSCTSGCEARRKLRHRIAILNDMLAENRRCVYEMEHYYET